jgi:SAM-dependent methyltransferase
MLYQNPDLYDALLPVSDNQLSFYRTLAQLHPGPALELACGTGQIVIPIAARGTPAVGLDNSPQMVAAARRRAQEAGARVAFVEADMRDFDLGQQFALIFIARNSLLHLSELDEFAALFAAVRRHLSPGGILAFDIFKPNFSRRSLWSAERFPAMRKTSPVFGELIVEEASDYDTLSQVNRATWFISTAEQRDAWVTPLHLRWIFPQELPALLAANGLHLVKRDGDYSGGEFSRESQLQVCQCQVRT